jgi:hypothetical protein
MEKSTIPDHFLGNFETFRGGKRTRYDKTKKKYLLNILPTHKFGQLCLEEFFLVSLCLGDIHFLLKILSLEEMQEGQS